MLVEIAIFSMSSDSGFGGATIMGELWSCLKLSVTGVNLSLPLECVVNVNGESKIGKLLKAPSYFHIAVMTGPNTLGHSDNIVDYEKLGHNCTRLLYNIFPKYEDRQAI